MASPQNVSSQNDLIEIFNGFNLWLKSKSYSNSTIRNYLSDINRYFQYNENSNPFSPDLITTYLDSIKSDSSYSRYLSSLSKFFQYAIDQNLIKIDPLKQAQKVKKPSIDDTLSDYQSFLNKKHFSQSTIRNYINDIQQFINFSQTTPSEPH